MPRSSCCRVRRSQSYFLYKVRGGVCLPRFWVMVQARFRKHLPTSTPSR